MRAKSCPKVALVAVVVTVGMWIVIGCCTSSNAQTAPSVGCEAASFEAAAGSPISAGDRPLAVATGDFNLDGKPDLAVANHGSSNVTILMGDGMGGFTQSAGSPLIVSAPLGVVTADFNSDGKPDLAVTSRGTNSVAILPGDGAGGFGPASNFGVGSAPQGLVVGDFNVDGKSDLVVANVFSSSVSVLLGDGAGSFGPASSFGVGSEPRYVVTADFNSDGKSDLAVSNSNSDSVSILLGNGAGSFGPASNLGVGDVPYSLAVGDFNIDGKSDLAVPNANIGNITIFLGDGVGGFTQPAGSPLSVGGTLDGPNFVGVNDFNFDGEPDLAIVKGNTGNVTIQLGDGAGGFTESAGSPFGVGSGPGPLAMGDFNLDSTPDLAIGNGLSDDVSILLNTCSAPTDLALSMTDTPDPIAVGASLTYALQVTNNGPSAATGVAISDAIPAGTTFVPSTSTDAIKSSPNCVISGSTVTCSIGSLGVGDAGSATVVVRAPASPVTLTNTATASGNESDPAPANNSYVEETQVRNKADLSVTNADAPDPAAVNENVTYTIAVKDIGPAEATNVVLTDIFDTAGKPVIFVSGSWTVSPASGGASGSCASSGPQATCPIGSLAKGATATVRITVRLLATGNHMNSASATADEIDPVATNNTKVQTTKAARLVVRISPSAGIVGGMLSGSTCDTGTGTVVVDQAAGMDRTVNLTNTNASATVPSSIILPAGQTSVAFSVTANTPVAATVTGTVKAAISGLSNSSTALKVLPVPVNLLTLTPATVFRPGSSTGTVVLKCEAGGSGIQVSLTSSNSTLARIVAMDGVTPISSIMIGVGQTTAQFKASSANAGSNKGSATITAQASGSTVKKTAKLTVK